METYCAPNVNSKGPKFRPPVSPGGLYKVPYSRNYRQYGNEYVHHGNYNNRRPMSPWQETPQRRDRLCPIALALASFIVLIVVLTVAGLALYMGALHTEFPSPLVAFSCSIKVLRGDRFVGASIEKARRYSLQFESLYKKSMLGPALVECNVDKFGEDTYTIHFRLTFDKRRLPRSSSSVEKMISDVISTDLISKKPVFKNIRFAPGSLRIQEFNLGMKQYQTTKKLVLNDTKRKSGNVLLKTPLTKNISLSVNPSSKKKQSPNVQGSFKISKTEADITEKQDTTPGRIKLKITPPSLKTTQKSAATTQTNLLTTEMTTVTLPPIQTTTKTTTISKIAASSNVIKISMPTKETVPEKNNQTGFSFEAGFFDKQPWTPLVFNESPLPHPPIESRIDTFEETNLKNYEEREPVYTSFTNPSLTIFKKKIDPLGVTNLKGHPLPVNKIVDITEPNVPTTRKYEEFVSNLHEITLKPEDDKFIEEVPLKVPNAFKPKRDEKIKNISTIFHDLATSIGNHDVKETIIQQSPSASPNFHNNRDDIVDINYGQGQVEVVDADEESLMKTTTKEPLVTLLPVKSNSGVGKPLRRRPSRRNHTNTNHDHEERTFSDSAPNYEKINKTTDSTTPKTTENQLRDFKIVGMLNFAPESSEAESVRKAKMEPSSTTERNIESQIMIHMVNSSGLNSRKPNILTPEKLKLLAEISRIHNETESSDEQPVISTKAIGPSYSLNNFGMKILSKYLNKVNVDGKKELVSENFTLHPCGTDDFICGDGKCLSKNAKCNHLKECLDGRDEQNCTCADYLRTQYLNKKICDGIVDCWDFSDENNCAWCHPGQYICANSKECIDNEKICDGVKDCLEGDDEGRCLNIAKNLEETKKNLYNDKGFLMVRKFGVWGKLCVDNLKNSTDEINNLGKEFCQSLTYKNTSSITVTTNEDIGEENMYEISKNESEDWSFIPSNCTQRQVARVNCNSLECGFRPRIVRYRARIVGGKNAGMGSWPWQAALYKEGEFQCGGSLLSDRWLMSAGHCFYRSQQEYWIARLGALRRSTTLFSPYEELIPIQKIFIHPGYENNGFVNDIALLRLKTPVTFSDYIRPVCLPQPGESLEDEVQCTILGWGQLSEVGRIFPDTLQEVQVPVISTEECRKRTVFLPLYNITEEMFCAGYERGGRDACLGDSGGPLICPEDNGHWVIHGITSNGYGCARANRPGVYTKVSSYIDWIQSYMDLNDTDSTFTVIESKDNKCSGHRCSLGQCLPKSQVCNGFSECNDGSDEINC